MTRIPDADIARLKSDVSLVRWLEGQGVELNRHGSDYVTRCPFHDDRTPSLVITPSKNLWHCLGACQTGGSIIDWVMKMENLSFRQAVERLQREVGAAPDPVNPSSLAAKDDPALLERVVAFYHQTLKASPEALAYLEKRGLSDPELVDRFRLGYANRSLGQRLPPKQVKAGAELRGRLQDLGLLRESGHEHFNGSIVVPIVDERGQVVEMYGRKIGDRLRKGTPLHLYLPGPHRGVFNREALTASKEIILCESLIDALTFWAAGFRNVTCAYGIEGFTDELMQAFKDHGTERVLIAYDRDEAGSRAAEKLAKRLMSEGIDCFRILFPKGMDANEYALQVRPASKSLGLVIRKAEWLGNGKAPAIETAADPIEAAAKEENDLPSLAADTEPEPRLPASPLPDMKPVDVAADVSDREVVMAFGDRRYRVRGLAKNTSYELLKVNVLVTGGEGMHVDSLDLYHAKQRAGYVRQASVELGVSEDVIKDDLAKVLLKLEALQDQQIQTAMKPEATKTLSSDEQDTALALLKDPNLLERIVADFEACGLVGEPTNALVGYLAAVSRKLDQPLAVIIQSTSAAGKSTLMDAVLDLMPEEERVHYSAMTGQSLFYMGEADLKHKILAIAEEEGVQQAAYALKLLQSEGELTIASTGKDDATGNLVTKEYRVEGPVMLLLTTTAVDIDEELMNRCVVLTVNESREQTRRIHAQQRQARTLAGLLARAESEQRIAVHRNAQRLLRPLKVVNPYAEQLTFLDDKTRTRRDHQKYLALIDAIALLHQHQRPVRSVEHRGQVIEYIEATLADIAVANRLAHEALGRSLDELPPQTRRLLGLIVAMVTDRCQAQRIERPAYRFSRRMVREHTGWGNTQLKVHLGRLEDLEYLLVHGGGRGRTIHYELAFDGDVDRSIAHAVGLIDPETLGYDEKKSGVKAEKSGSSRPQVGDLSAPGRGGKNGSKAELARPDVESAAILPKTRLSRGNGVSHRTGT